MRVPRWTVIGYVVVSLGAIAYLCWRLQGMAGTASGVPSFGLPPAAAPKNQEHDEETVKRINHLIGMLASRNAKPKIAGTIDERVADIYKNPAYDKNLQVPVYLAMQQLLGEDEAVLELLLKHTDDERYCLTLFSYSDDENVTVGTICKRIFMAKLRPFEPELHRITRGQGVDLTRLYRGKSEQEWWKETKKVGLAKVQIETIEMQLDFMRKADVKTAEPLNREGHKHSPEEFERYRKENIRILELIRETITSTGKPYHPRTCLRGEEVIGLPWVGNPHK